MFICRCNCRLGALFPIASLAGLSSCCPCLDSDECRAGVDQPEPAEGYLLAAKAARQQASQLVMRKGVHPYRIVLSDLVRRLRNAKTRLQEQLSGRKPDDGGDWCAGLLWPC